MLVPDVFLKDISESNCVCVPIKQTGQKNRAVEHIIPRGNPSESSKIPWEVVVAQFEKDMDAMSDEEFIKEIVRTNPTSALMKELYRFVDKH